jgi:hypothetical protein
VPEPGASVRADPKGPAVRHHTVQLQDAGA